MYVGGMLLPNRGWTCANSVSFDFNASIPENHLNKRKKRKKKRKEKIPEPPLESTTLITRRKGYLLKYIC